MADYTKYIEKLFNERDDRLNKVAEIISKLNKKTDGKLYSFAITPFNSKQFMPGRADPIKTKFEEPKCSYQLFTSDLKLLKKVFLNYRELTCYETIRADYSKMFFDIDCLDSTETERLIKTCELINELVDYFQTSLSGIIEYSDESIVEKLPIKPNENLLFKYNPKKIKLCSGHLFLKNLKFKRDDLVKLFKPLYYEYQKIFSPVGGVFDASVYKRDGSQQAFRVSLFVKPGKQSQLADYTEEELNTIIDNIDEFIAQPSADDKATTIDFCELDKIIKKYTVEPELIKRDKKYYNETLNMIVSKFADDLKTKSNKHINLFSAHSDWIKNIVKLMKEFIIKNNLDIEEENTTKILFDEFIKDKYKYYSKSQGKYLTQPTSIKWAIEHALKSVSSLCHFSLNKDITIEYSEFLNIIKNPISFNYFAYIFNHTFAFFDNSDLADVCVILENGQFVKKSLKKFETQTNEIIVRVVFKSADKIKIIPLKFKQCLKIFEKFQCTFHNIAISSEDSRVFSMYNKPTTTIKIYNKLPYQIDQILNLFCNYDESRKEFLLNWLAYLLQYPHKRNHTAIQITTPQGTGKNLIFNIVAEYLEQYGNINGDIKDLYSDFNSILADKKLIIFNECPKNTKDLGKLKSFITEDKIQIKEKYMPEYITDNLTNSIILSNHFDTNTIEDNDRRFTFFYSTLKPLPKEFYDEAIGNKELKNQFIRFLLSRDLTDYSPDEPYDDDDKKLVYESRKTNRHIIYKLIDYVFKNDKTKKELTINQLNELIDKIKNQEDETIKNDRLVDEIQHEIIPILTNKTINNLLQYSKTDDYYLDYNTIKRKITDFNDIYNYIDEHKTVKLSDLKKQFNYLTDKNYKTILNNYEIIKNENNESITIKVKDLYDDVFEFINKKIADCQKCLLSDIIENFKCITIRNYRTVLSNYEIEKINRRITITSKVDLEDY